MSSTKICYYIKTPTGYSWWASHTIFTTDCCILSVAINKRVKVPRWILEGLLPKLENIGNYVRAISYFDRREGTAEDLALMQDLALKLKVNLVEYEKGLSPPQTPI